MTDEVPLRDSPEAKRAFNALFGSLSRESDRGLVLVGVSFLDAQLEAFLRAKFSLESPKTQAAIDPLFDTFGPLASFSAKSRVAYALDLIDDSMCRDLELLRKLRNRFAHTTEQAEFDAPDVVKLTEKLEGADHAVRALKKRRVASSEGPSEAQRGITSERGSRSEKAEMEHTRVVLTICWIHGGLYGGTRTLTKYSARGRAKASPEGAN